MLFSMNVLHTFHLAKNKNLSEHFKKILYKINKKDFISSDDNKIGNKVYNSTN